MLAMAYLPMLVASVVHIHHETEGVAMCVDCVHHVNHPAHFGAASSTVHDCLYCHLLSLPRIIAVAVAGMAVFMEATRISVSALTLPHVTPCGVASLRAPPEVIGYVSSPITNLQ